MESLSPNIFVDNMTETIDFYKSIGFQVVMTVPEMGTEFVWAMLVNGDVTFMFQTFASLGDELPNINRSDGFKTFGNYLLWRHRVFYTG